MEKRAIQIDKGDNVAVVAQPVDTGETVLIVEKAQTIKALESIRTGHKIAIAPIANGELIIKYGIPIGRATQDIAVGNWVHVHNVEDITEELCNRYTKEYRQRGKQLWERRLWPTSGKKALESAIMFWLSPLCTVPIQWRSKLLQRQTPM